jgi:citrate lyase subunit beta/citryl-CoA lyase
MLEKAAGSEADEIFLDLEDAVAPREKEAARGTVVEALRTHDYGDKVVVVRVNACDTHWCYTDLVHVVSEGGDRLDCVMIPKVESARDLHFVHTLLEQVERGIGRTKPLGIEAQVESAAGVFWMREIALATPRLETLIFGPGDFSANVGMPSLSLGAPVPGYPGDHWHHVLSSIVTGARAVGAQPIDGPYGQFRDEDGLREMAHRSRALGFDGKWAIHPRQVEDLNETFSPTEDQVRHARAVLAALDQQARENSAGAVALDGQMLDEAVALAARRVLARAGADL